MSMFGLFFVLIGLVAVTRIIELGVSRRHRSAMIKRGARAIPERGFPIMVMLHVGILAGAVLEAVLMRRELPVWFALLAAAGVLAANVLRIAAIRSLGQHWNVRVVDSTAFGVVTSGPYRWIRHPNYVAVFLELLLLPLVQGAWLTAAAGAVLHVIVLRRRIALEESVLLADSSYAASMGGKPRFIPRLGGRSVVVSRSEPS